jgi:hypothetical protein
MNLLARYAREWEVPTLEAEGWVCSAFYAYRGGVACFLMTKEATPEEEPAP